MIMKFFCIIIFIIFTSCSFFYLHKEKNKSTQILKSSNGSNCGEYIAKILKKKGIVWCDSDTMSLNTDGYFFEGIKKHLNVDFMSPVKQSYYFKICDTSEIGDHCTIYIHEYESKQIAEGFKNRIDSIYSLKVTEINMALFDALHYGKGVFIAKDSLLIYFFDEIGDTPCARVKKAFEEIK